MPYYNNAYDLLKDKICNPRTSINESGKMYSNFEEAKFEEAKSYYLSNKSQSVSEEINKLHEIIDFVYLGRESIM